MNGRDPGAQIERTQLSWRRTVLAATVVALLGLRQLATDHAGAGGIVLGCLLALSWLIFSVTAQKRIQHLSQPRRVPLQGRWPALVGGTVLAVVLLAGVASLP